MNNNNPLVSICIPVYNGELMIKAALESAINQTYKNLEIIVSDNASMDRTKEIILQYAKNDKRIKYLRNKNNLGFTGNLLKVFNSASGEYVQLLCHDDRLSKNYIEAGIKNLREQKRAAAVFFRLVSVDGAGDYFKFNEGVNFRSGNYSRDYFLRNMYKTQWASICIISLLRREYLAEAIEFIEKILEEHRNQPDFRYYHIGVMVDWLIFLKIIKYYDYLIFSNESAYIKVDHANNEGKRHGWSFDVASGWLDYYNFHKKSLDYIYPIEFKKHSLGMSVFMGSEAINSILFNFIKKGFDLRFMRSLNFNTIKKFFSIFTLKEVCLILINTPIRFLLRMTNIFLKKLKKKKNNSNQN